MAEDTSWAGILAKTLVIDPTGSLARDFITDPLTFADRVRSMEEIAALHEITSQAAYELVITGNNALYPVTLIMAGIDDDTLRLVVAPHHANTLEVMRKGRATVSYVELTTYRKSTKQMVWKGLFKTCKLTDDGKWHGLRTFDMEYQDHFVFVDNREKLSG